MVDTPKEAVIRGGDEEEINIDEYVEVAAGPSLVKDSRLSASSSSSDSSSDTSSESVISIEDGEIVDKNPPAEAVHASDPEVILLVPMEVGAQVNAVKRSEADIAARQRVREEERSVRLAKIHKRKAEDSEKLTLESLEEGLAVATRNLRRDSWIIEDFKTPAVKELSSKRAKEAASKGVEKRAREQTMKVVEGIERAETIKMNRLENKLSEKELRSEREIKQRVKVVKRKTERHNAKDGRVEVNKLGRKVEEEKVENSKADKSGRVEFDKIGRKKEGEKVENRKAEVQNMKDGRSKSSLRILLSPKASIPSNSIKSYSHGACSSKTPSTTSPTKAFSEKDEKEGNSSILKQVNFTADRARLPRSTEHAQAVSLPGSTGPPQAGPPQAARLQAARLQAARLQAARLQAARLQATRPQAACSVSYPDGVCSSKSSSTKSSPTKSPSVQDLVKNKEGKNSLLKQVNYVVVDRGSPCLYVTCQGVTDLNRHHIEYALHFEQARDSAMPLHRDGSDGYAYILRGFASLAACRSCMDSICLLKFCEFPINAMERFEASPPTRTTPKKKAGKARPEF